MTQLKRISLSIEKPLFDRLEALVKKSAYANRSAYVRDLVRGRLVEEKWEKNHQALATLTIVYDHHSRHLSKRLTELQHRRHRSVLATTHVHLDERLCAEMIMMRARARDIKQLADRLTQEKGVLHASLSMSSTGKGLS